jgi:protein subunit release factor A
MPYVKGYKPLYSYQALLEEEVLAVLHMQKGIDKVFFDFASTNVVHHEQVNFGKWKKPIPVEAERKQLKPRVFKPVKRNYLEIEQNNRSVGALGEQLVYDYEIWRLNKAELPKLAEQVKWISKDLGDGAGYDILSKDRSGKDMFIEVKTTKLGKESPIFFSGTEYDFSKIKIDRFFLYRVFDVKEDPKVFIKNGQLDNICSFIEATNFRGYF